MDNTPTPPYPAPKQFSWKTLLIGVVLGIVIFVLGVFGVLLGSFVFYRKEAVTKMAEVKELKPLLLRADLDWSVNDLKGNPVNLNTLEGKPLLIHFWSPACVSCIAEIPSLNALYDTFQPKGLRIVGIALYADEDLVVDVAEHGIRFPVYSVDTTAIPAIFTPTATPTTFIIDGKGFVTLKQVGATDWSSGDGAAFVASLLAS